MLSQAEISDLLFCDVQKASEELDASRLDLVFATVEIRNNSSHSEFINSARLRHNAARQAFQEAVDRFAQYTLYGIVPADLERRLLKEPVSTRSYRGRDGSAGEIRVTRSP